MKVIFAAALALLGAYSVYYLWANSEPPIRYRITATVTSGGQTYTGTGVFEVRVKFQGGIAPGAIKYLTGEAIVVDVPGRSPVFFLLTSDWVYEWGDAIPYTMFLDTLPDGLSGREIVRGLAELRTTATIPPDRYPLIVAFRDLSQPDSVYEVFANDLSPPLDPPARVVSLTIEMTDERPTTGIVEEKLPWLPDLAGYLDGEEFSFSNDLAGRLHGGHFTD